MKRREMLRNRLFAGAMSVAFLLSGACADSGNTEEPGDTQPAAVDRPEDMTREERRAMRQKLEDARRLQQSPIEPIGATPKPSGVIGEVPSDLLDKIFADLEKQTGAMRAEFEVLQAEAKQWNDGALGCPEPGQAYTQAIVDGYQVIIDYQGQSFDYHASASGFFTLCTGFRPNR